MKKLNLLVTAMILPISSFATDLVLSDKPLEVPQGAVPNIVIIMDDSGSMDWESMTENFDISGRFKFNQPTGNADVASSGPVKQRSTCVIDTTYYYGVEFESNAYPDDANDCRVADEEAWRFRNKDFNPLYYDPSKTYKPWPGLSTYVSPAYPEGVPYDQLVEQFQLNESTSATFELIGFDNPSNPGGWLDLNYHNTSWDETTSGARTKLDFSDKDNDNIADGFSYYTWTDTNGNGLYDNADKGDTIVEVRVNTLSLAKQQNFQNWFNFYRSREFSVKASLHFVFEDMIAARVGYTTLNKSTYNVEVAELNPSATAIGGSKQKLFQKLDETAPAGGTPLRLALRDVGNYYSCSSTDNKFGSDTCPYLPIDDGGTCQQNYALLFSDGFWNQGTPSVGNEDGFSGSKFDGGAFADGWSDTLADVAMKYYKTDLKTDYPNEVPPTITDTIRAPTIADDELLHQHMKTYTVAFGLGLSSFNPGVFDYIDPTSTINWPDPSADRVSKVIDMLHAAYNGRGYFYGAKDYDTLTKSLIDSFSKILADQSGAAGVSFNSQELKTGVYLFRAFYNPATFDGDLVAIEFDNNGNPKVDTPVWSASDELAKVIENNQRLIVSYDPGTRSGILFDYDAGLNATQQAWFEQMPPTSLPTGYGDADVTHGDERVDFLWGDETLEGTRFDLGELRDRDGLLGDFANSTPRYVGIPQGTKRDFEPYPTVPGTLYSEFKKSLLNRTQLVYAGANDGMLHGFNANTGSEVFAFVPNEVMDDLYEYTLPGYLHEMSVDGSPGINDVFIKDGTEKWRTVLMNGLRAGGKGYFALDITNPATFTKTAMPNNVMWEFTAADDERLGYTFSTPNMVMTNAKYAGSGNQRWAALFGNGFNQTHVDGESALFALFIDGGLDGNWNKTSKFNNFNTDDYIVMQTGKGSFTQNTVTYPNGLSTPRGIDTDGNGTVDYVYAGDLEGNLFRFNMTSVNPADWAMEDVLFTASYPVDNTTNSWQPITVQPIVTRNDTNGGYNVVFTTGSWMTVDDMSSTDIQSLYAIWDITGAIYPVVRKELVQQSFTNQLTPIEQTTYRTLSNLSVNYKSVGGKRTMGWKIDFDICPAGSATCVTPEYPGERGIRNLLIKEGILFGVTILPSSNAACSDAPGGYLFSINSQTGGLAGDEPTFDLNDDGVFDEADTSDTDGTIVDNEIPAAIRIDDGLPSDIAIIDGGGNEGSKVCYQTSTGKLVCSGANVNSSFAQGRLSWKELAD